VSAEKSAMMNRWKKEMSTFSLSNSSFGALFDKRYAMLKVHYTLRVASYRVIEVSLNVLSVK
jgi:hypothetical protein